LKIDEIYGSHVKNVFGPVRSLFCIRHIDTYTVRRGGSIGGYDGHSKVCPSVAPPLPQKFSVKWLRCAMLVLATSLCLAFSDADIEFDFVLMTRPRDINKNSQ